MALSTSPVSSRPEAADPFDQEALARFYRWQAHVYDWTRPLILFGRRQLLDSLDVAAGARVLDVGCGTGWSFGPLAARGARIVGVECSPAMRRRAEARRRARRLEGSVRLDPRPYGSHDGYLASVDHMVFSYSLSMMPPYEEILSRAVQDLAPWGSIGVVDFLDAPGPVAAWLSRCHVSLGPQRLRVLSRLFPVHDLQVRSAGLWRYFLFRGDAP